MLLGFRIRDLDIAADAVELEGDSAHTVFIHFAGSKVLDDQGLAVRDIDAVGLADGETVEEDVAAQAHEQTIVLSVLVPVLIYLRIEGIGEDGAPLVVGLEGRDFAFELFEVDGLKQLAGTAGDGFLALEDDFLQILGEAP